MVGWMLEDESGRTGSLSALGTLDPGASATIQRNAMAMSLNNNRDEIMLLDQGGQEQDRFAYTGSAEGLPLQTGH